MTKKNLKPQQAAPVQREINTTFSVGGTGLIPLYQYLQNPESLESFCRRRRGVIPFILTLTSKSVKSLFLSPLADGSHL
jgi:prenylated cyclic peptide (anacyclamide/piricyclamide family)